MKNIVYILMIFTLALTIGCSKKEVEAQGQEAQKIKEVYRVAIDPAYPPFEYYVGVGELAGFDIDLISEVARRVGFELEFIEESFSDVIPSIKAGKNDFAVSAMTITSERNKSVTFSDPYFEAYQKIVARIDSPEIEDIEGLAEGYSLGAQLGTSGEELIRSFIHEQSNVKTYDLGLVGAMEVASGKIDYMFIDSAPADFIIANNKDKLKILNISFDPENYGFAFDKQDTYLVEQVNAALKEIFADGTYDAILMKHFGQ